jgi:hypothetical protein
MNRFLSSKDAVPHFRDLDSAIDVAAPKISEELRKMRVNSIHFAMRWQMLLFADEHDFPDTWRLWDAIIARRANASAFVNHLSIAHVLQVPLKESENVIEVLQKYRRWNVPKLIQTAEELLAPSWKNKLMRKGVVVALLALLFFILVAWWCRTQKNPV